MPSYTNKCMKYVLNNTTIASLVTLHEDVLYVSDANIVVPHPKHAKSLQMLVTTCIKCAFSFFRQAIYNRLTLTANGRTTLIKSSQAGWEELP